MDQETKYNTMTVFIGADHRGFNLKEKLKSWLDEKGMSYEDLGAVSYDKADDYPIYAERVARKVAGDNVSFGIVLCGSGAGVDIVANKIDGVRSCLGINPEQVKNARQDDNVNVLSIAADFVDENTALLMVNEFLNTAYLNSKSHERRVNQVKDIEKQ